MLLNLGLTADAAAAHKHDFSPESPPSMSSSDTTSPLLSFMKLPFLGLGALLSSYRNGSGTSQGGKDMPQDISPDPADTESSSEEDLTSPADQPPLRFDSIKDNKKPSLRPKTSYQLAHPAGNPLHKRLTLRPKLLLQVQQVSQTTRPIPVVDVIPSTGYLPRFARKFPTIFRGENGLGPNDLIVMKSELYEQSLSPGAHYQAGNSSNGNNEHREVVATICQLSRDDARSKGNVEICLNHGPVWEGSRLPNGSYEFVAHTDHGTRILRWVSRNSKSRRAPTSPQDNNKRFTFSVIDPTTRRHPVIARMTHNHLEVYDEYSIPFPSASTTAVSSYPNRSTLSIASVTSGSSDTECKPGKNTIQTDDHLRTLITITGIWIAFKEGWSHNFSYNDSIPLPIDLKCASASSPTRSKHSSLSPANFKPIIDNAYDDNVAGGLPDLPPSPLSYIANNSQTSPSVRRSNTLSPSGGDGGKSSGGLKKFGSLSRRSNSVGAAFLKNASNRFDGGSSSPNTNANSSRLQRQSMISSPTEALQDQSCGPATAADDFAIMTHYPKVPWPDTSTSAHSRHSMMTTYSQARPKVAALDPASAYPDTAEPWPEPGPMRTSRTSTFSSSDRATPGPPKKKNHHQNPNIKNQNSSRNLPMMRTACPSPGPAAGPGGSTETNSNSKIPKSNTMESTTSSGKGRLRHRLSSLFDGFGRKGVTH